jgi:Beta-propeller repeat
MLSKATHKVLALLFLVTVLAARADTQSRPIITQSYGRMPMSFELNQGQTDARVKFISRGNGYTLFLAPAEAVLSLGPQDPRILRMRLLEGNAEAEAEGIDRLPGTTNYFLGNDSARWRKGVPNYSQVKFDDVYPGVDLVYYGNQQRLEYDLIVRPGADPQRIRLKFDGADAVRVDAGGDLVLTAAGHEIRQQRPVVYQTVEGRRQEIAGRYVLRGKDEAAFEVTNYNASNALVIDPVLIYSTYWGGGPYTQGLGIAVDTSGNIYITGWTYSTAFPTVNPLPLTSHGGNQIFLTKMTNTGTVLSSSVFGGSTSDFGYGIAVDSLGYVYLTGYTQSSDFPTANAWQPHFAGGGGDAFVMKVDLTANSLVYSTYLGGSNNDQGAAITVDGGGNAYVTGATYSTNFPVYPAGKVLQSSPGGGSDAFVTKLSSTGAPLYSTYFGGPVNDWGTAIAVDSAGNAYVTGGTLSPGLATTGAFQTTCQGCSGLGGNGIAYVLKLSPDGAAKSYFTYLGGSGGATGTGIALDGAGDAYVTGVTSSPSFPLAKPLQSTLKAQPNAFVTELNATGSALVFSTYLGGSADTRAAGITIDSWGNVYVAGSTAATDFPTLFAIQSQNAGGHDVFVTAYNRINGPGGEPAGFEYMYSTYLGGSSDDYGLAIAGDGSGNVFVTGEVDSSNFPTLKPAQAGLNGEFNAFVFEISPSNAAPPSSGGGSGSGGGGGGGGHIIGTHPPGN